MLNLNEVKAGNKIRFTLKEVDYDSHFEPLNVYKVYDLMDFYPNQYSVPTNVLVICCEEGDIHFVNMLFLNEWEIV